MNHSRHRTISSVIIWSVISAAFIGPGTVTTAASAGATYRLDLLWCVVFAVIACILLQELSARLAITSGFTFGQTLDVAYGDQRGKVLKLALAWPVWLGCAAYEAGNILGAVSGIVLITGGSPAVITCAVTVAAAAVLWIDKKDAIGWLMTFLVALMGVAFLWLAFAQPFTPADYIYSSFIPVLPEGSELLMLGLVGTTIVPYNLFLGSAISRGQTVPLMRIGLVISVAIGGIITAGILVAGTAVPPFTSFTELAASLTTQMGTIGGMALAIGLFGAGFSSAITSPYAASLIASSVFNWDRTRQRIVWGIVLATGFGFGISGVRPIPVILAVQALNGLVLPLLSAFLILLVNHRKLMGDRLPSITYNVILLFIFLVVLMMGLHSIDKSLSEWMNATAGHFGWIVSLSGMLTVLLGYLLRRQLRQKP